MASAGDIYRHLLLLSVVFVASVVVCLKFLNYGEEPTAPGVEEPKEQQDFQGYSPRGRHDESRDVASLTKCFRLPPSTFYNKSHSAVVFSRCSRQAAQFAAATLRTGASLLLITEPLCLQHEYKFLLQRNPEFITPTSLSVITTGSDCNATSLAAEIVSRDVDEVHVIVDSEDFLVTDSPQVLGDLNRCYVSLLEAVRSGGRTPAVFFHVQGDSVEVRRSMLVQSDGQRRILKKSEELFLCSYDFDETRHGDVMKFILFMYTTVYESLYNLRHVYLAVDS